jgi:hypothetical protein
MSKTPPSSSRISFTARARKVSLDHDDAPEQAKRFVTTFVYPSLTPPDAEGCAPTGTRRTE